MILVDSNIPMYLVGAAHPHKLDAQRLLESALSAGERLVTDAEVRNARHGYYAMISYVDRKFGELMEALAATGLADDTVVIVTADHGDMLGERGLWYKMNFFERSTITSYSLVGG